MFATPAFAQTATGGAADLLTNIVPFVMIFVILYLMVIRPQQKRSKQHREMVLALRRGDTVITNGGLIGRVAKVAEAELDVDIAENVRVRILRSAVSEVRAKGEPVAIEAAGEGEPVARKARGGGSGKSAKAAPRSAPANAETNEQETRTKSG